jgi:hypothetical protein
LSEKSEKETAAIVIVMKRLLADLDLYVIEAKVN